MPPCLAPCSSPFLSGRNHLLPGRPLPGLGREAGLQGLRQHLRLQRLAAAAGERSSLRGLVLAAWAGAVRLSSGSRPCGVLGSGTSRPRGRVLPATPRSAHGRSACEPWRGQSGLGAEWTAGQRGPFPFRPVPWHVSLVRRSGLNPTRPPQGPGSEVLPAAGGRQAGWAQNPLERPQSSGRPRQPAAGRGAGGEPCTGGSRTRSRQCLPGGQAAPRTSGHSGA